MILMGCPGSGREALLHRISSSWHPQQSRAVLRFVGIQHDRDSSVDATATMTMKWRTLLRELYERVGVNCESVTLLIKRIESIPSLIVNQMLSLMVTGDVPGAFTLEEQIKMATRVRDERLVEIETKYKTRVEKIRHSVNLQREREIEAARTEERENYKRKPPAFYEDIERRYQQSITTQLAQVQLRYHQDMDDLVRQSEVETESVTTTIMSLIRPLGIKSGKWQQIVDRIRKRLSIVLFVELEHESSIRARIPQLFSRCSIVGVPRLGFDSLRVLLFAQISRAIQSVLPIAVKSTVANADDAFPSETASAGMSSAASSGVKSLVWQIAGLAAKMHLTAVQLTEQQYGSKCKTSQAWMMASLFTEILAQRVREINAMEQKYQRFLNAVRCFEAVFVRLRESDLDLEARIEQTQAEIVLLKKKAAEQNEDVERIRIIMLRFQGAAEEQVKVTNAMQDTAEKELQVPLACVDEANSALLLIDKRHIVEIKSFTSPPLMVHLVLDAICVLFRLEPTWENARKILGDSNVVQTMLTFDKDAVPAEVLTKLEREYLSDDRFNQKDVERQSVAASMMVVWVRAVHQYASARLLVKPTLDKLEKSQARLKLLMQEFQVSKGRVVEAEDILNATKMEIASQQTHKQQLEDRLESRAARLESAQQTLDYLIEDKRQIEKTILAIKKGQSKNVVWWNALLSSGALTYTGTMSQCQRHKVFSQWTLACRQWVDDDDDDSPIHFTLLPTLALAPNVDDDDELDGQLDAHADEEFISDVFKKLAIVPPGSSYYIDMITSSGVYFSRRRLHDISLLSTVAVVPDILVVMVAQFNELMETLIVKCANELWRWTKLQMIFVRAPDFNQVLATAVREGQQLIVLDVKPSDCEGNLRAVLDWKACELEGRRHLGLVSGRCENIEGESDASTEAVNNDGTVNIPIHSEFKLILTTHLERDAFGDVLARIPVINSEINSEEIQDVLLDQLWSPERGIATTKMYTLDDVLRSGSRFLKDRDLKHNMLTGLVERAVIAGDLELATMQQIRDQCNVTKESRLEVKRKINEIEQEISTVKANGRDVARVGAEIFNALNATLLQTRQQEQQSRLARIRSVPPLSLHIYISMLFRALAPSQPRSIEVPSPHRRRQGVPQFEDAAQSPRSLRASVNLVRHTRLLGLSRQPSESQPKPHRALLNQLVPSLESLISCRSDWYYFLTQLILRLEQSQQRFESRPRDLSVAVESVEVATTGGDEEKGTSNVNAKTGETSVRSLLSRLKCNRIAKRSLDSRDAMDVQIRNTSIIDVLQTLVSQQPTSDNSDGKNGSLLGHLSSVQPRSARLQLVLCIFPDLVPQACAKILEGYGVRLGGKFSSSTNTLTYPRKVLLEVLHEFPESVATILTCRRDFNSFSFLWEVFSLAVNSDDLRLAMLKYVHKRRKEIARGSNDGFRIPRSVVLPDARLQHEETRHQILLTLNNVQELLEMEKSRIDELEITPLALVNMTSNCDAGCWEHLFRVLNRSTSQPSSIIHERSVKAVVPGQTTARGTVSMGHTPPHRIPSSKAVTHRESAAALVTPAYPRLLAVVESLDDIPVPFRKHFVCITGRTVSGRSSQVEGRGGLLNACLQRALLRLVYHPFEYMFKPPECVKPGIADTGKSFPWLPEIGSALTSLLIFHALLAFRFETSRAVEARRPTLTRYTDDVLVSALSQIAVVIQELMSRPEKERKINRTAFDQQCRLHILGVYSRLAPGEYELSYLNLLLRECFEVGGDRQADRSNQSALQIDTFEQSATRTRSYLHRISSLATLAPPSAATMAAWIDNMWTYISKISAEADSSLRLELFGVKQAPDLFESGNSLQTCPWVDELGWTREYLGASRDIATAVSIDTALASVRAVASCLPAIDAPQQERSSQVLEAVDDAAAPSPATRGVLLFEQAQVSMLMMYQHYVRVYHHYFHNLGEQLSIQTQDDSPNSDSPDPRAERSQPLATLRDRALVRQACAVLCNQIPSELHAEIASAGLPSTCLLHDAVQHLQRWHWFHQRTQHDHKSDDREATADDIAQSSSTCSFWWTPALVMASLSVAQAVELSMLRVQSVEGSCHRSVTFTLRTACPSDGAIDYRVDDVMQLPPGTFVALDGLRLFGADWSDEREQLEPATTWRAQSVSLLGVWADPIRPDGVGDDLAFDEKRPVRRLVPLLAKGDTGLLGQWKLAAAPTLGILATPFLSAQWC